MLSAQNRLVQTLAHLPDDPTKNPDILSLANRILSRQDFDMLSKDLSIKIFSVTPSELRGLLEDNGLQVERIFCKIASMPLRFSCCKRRRVGASAWIGPRKGAQPQRKDSHCDSYRHPLRRKHWILPRRSRRRSYSPGHRFRIRALPLRSRGSLRTEPPPSRGSSRRGRTRPRPR